MLALRTRLGHSWQVPTIAGTLYKHLLLVAGCLAGSLPVEWDLQRVGDMGVGVEVENWVEPSRPRNEREKLHDFIVQEGLLQLQPPVGCLAPGESTTWTLTYK